MTPSSAPQTSDRPIDPDGPTGRLVTWLAELHLDQIPDEVIERAKDVILDGLGCALTGAKLPWSITAVEAVLAMEGQGDATVIGWDETTSAPAAALLNGTFIQGFELDDFHPTAPLHSASLLIPALLAASESAGVSSGRAFLLAAIAGFEVGPRVGLALHGTQMLSRGWHSGAVFGTHAAAAGVGVMLGLSPAVIEDALGLAGTQSAGLMAAQYEAMCKRMHHGFAARNGFYSAMLAKGGYTGIKRVFEREYGGFLSVFGEGHEPDASQIDSDLGERWETLRIALKPYAAMGALHSSLDVILELGREEKIDPTSVRSIDVYLSHVAYHHGWWEPERPLTPIGAQMNVAYAVAVALIDGAAMADQFAPSRIDADDVWALVPRIKAHHDPAFDAQKETRGSVRLIVTLNDGTVREGGRAVPDTIGKPLDRAAVSAKFDVLTREVIDGGRAGAIREVVLDLENRDLSELLPLLRGASTPLF